MHEQAGPPPARPARGPLVGLALSTLLVACGRGRAPHWDALSLDHAPAWLDPATAQERPLGDAHGSRVVVGDDGAWIETRIVAKDWTPRDVGPAASGVWQASVDTSGLGQAPGGAEPASLTADGEALRVYDGDASHPGWFYSTGGHVFLGLAPGAEPPATACLRVAATPGKLLEGGGWRLFGRRFDGDGFPVWPGEAITLDESIPPDAALRFSTVVERASDDTVGQEVRFRVMLDGAPLFEHAQEITNRGSRDWHEVTLPPGGCKSGRLRFEVEGPFAFCSIFEPGIGPKEVGTYGARPWKPRAPDIVLFLADTFRADNLRVYDGEGSFAPNLDRFAAESLCFRRAWSVSTFTLPAHASMFTGLFPRQAGTDRIDDRLRDDFETIAEALAARGYRTGAVTDGFFVSAVHGMAQGFGCFDEGRVDMDSTLARARAFLDDDDGRPVFLFVHTYQTHMPYHVSEAARAAKGGALGLEPDETIDRYQDATAASGPAVADRLRRLYLGSVVDLDRGFEELRGDLERRGILARGWVVFTSDHGEAFLEHGELFHGGRVHEEQVRVPLLVHGPGVTPGVVQPAASLVDLSPTLGTIAGLAPLERWQGSSLLTLREDRPILAFDCREGEASVALVDGAHKVIAVESEDGRSIAPDLRGAYDLARDPGEEHDLLEGARPAWVTPLVERLTPAVDDALTPLVERAHASMSAEHVEGLRALGYGGH